MSQLLVMTLLSLALLAIYAYSIVEAIGVAALCDSAPGKLVPPSCVEDTKLGSVADILNSISGLISGTIVGVLAIAKPNELPAPKLFGGKLGGLAQMLGSHVPVVIICVWICCGVAMVIAGLIKYDGVVPSLSAQAKAWLGAAVAALIAYYGANRDPNNVKGEQTGAANADP